jgi:hypothetical protein
VAGRLVTVEQELAFAVLVDAAVVVVMVAAAAVVVVDRLDGYTQLDYESQPELNKNTPAITV